MVGPQEHTYDLFVSYADADYAWVKGYLFDALNAAGICYCSESEFALGVPRLVEIERAVKSSQRTLLVISQAYLAEAFAQFADLLAQTYGLETQTWPVIPLILHPVQLPVRLSALIALDATEPENWNTVVERLFSALRKPVPKALPRPPCPYPGMVPFSPQDAAHFFGRDREIGEMCQKLRHQNCLFVIGPSGSGKSSLVLAGLIPRLTQQPGEGWLVRTIRPGESPLATLNQALVVSQTHTDQAFPKGHESESPQSSGQRLLLVVDQLEELFVQAPKSEQHAFIAAVNALRQAGNCAIIFTMRADFYPDLMNSALWPVHPAERVEIAPPRGDALRQAILRPAENVGVYVETGLLERLLSDAADEPGVLSLIQETMVLLWDRMTRRLLPFHTYRQLGSDGRTGLAVAIAAKADATVVNFSSEQWDIARRIFLRLIQFGEGRADTRRQQTISELRAIGDDDIVFDRVLYHLTDNRLLTLSGEESDAERKADIAHEALINGWPTLRQWVDQRREAEQTRRRLENKALEWTRMGRGEGGLLDDIELLEARRWLESPDAVDLGQARELDELVQASQIAVNGREARRKRAVRFRRGAVGAIALLIIAALGIGIWSAQQNASNQETIAQRERQLADQRQEAAETAEADRVIQITLVAESEVRRLGAVSANQTTQVEIVARSTAEANAREKEQLALARAAEAVSARETAEAEIVVRRTAEANAINAQSVAETRQQESLARQLAAQAQIELGDTGTGLVRSALLAVEALRTYPNPAGEQALHRYLGLLPCPEAQIDYEDSAQFIVAFEPDRRLLATKIADGTISVWDVGSRKELSRLDWDTNVMNAAFASDGEHLAIADNHMIQVWDVETGKVADELTYDDEPKSGVLRDIVFSPDLQWVVFASEKTVKVWNLYTKQELIRVPYDRIYRASVFSSDGNWLATVGPKTVQIWQVGSWYEAARLETEFFVESVAFSPDGQWLAASSDTRGGTGIVSVWEITTGHQITKMMHDDAVFDIEFSPDGRRLVTGSADNTARVWEVSSGRELARMMHEGWVWEVHFSPGGVLVATRGDRAIRLWNPITGDEVTRLPQESPRKFFFSHYDTQIITTNDNSVLIWETSSLCRTYRIDHVLDAVLGSSGRSLALGKGDGSLEVLDLDTGQSLAHMMHNSAVTRVAFDPTEQRVASVDDNGTVRIWETANGQEIVRIERTAEVQHVVFSPDGSLLAIAGNQSVTLYQSSTGQEIAQLGHSSRVLDLAFSPDGIWIAAAASEGEIALWEASTGRSTRIEYEPFGMAAHNVTFSPDSQSLIASSYVVVYGWETATGEEVLRLQHGPSGDVFALALSPNGKWLGTAGMDNSAAVWDLATGKELVRMPHENPVVDVAFSSDGLWLATVTTSDYSAEGGVARIWEVISGKQIVQIPCETKVDDVTFSADDKWLVMTGKDTVHVWSLWPENIISDACARLPRNLTYTEWEEYLPDEPYHITCPNLPGPQQTGQ